MEGGSPPSSISSSDLTGGAWAAATSSRSGTPRSYMTPSPTLCRPWRSRTRGGRSSHAHYLDLEGFGSHGWSPPSSLPSSDLTSGARAGASPATTATSSRSYLSPAWSVTLLRREGRSSAAPCSSDDMPSMDWTSLLIAADIPSHPAQVLKNLANVLDAQFFGVLNPFEQKQLKLVSTPGVEE